MRAEGIVGATGWPQAPIPATAWTVDGTALFESHMGKDGSDYTVLARWP